MANTSPTQDTTDLGAAPALVGVYVAISLLTVLAVAVLSATAPRLATADAWWHAAIVAVFAVVLSLRVRAARRGSRRALRASLVIAVVLTVANVVEAALPGVFPGWMRVDIVVVVVVMALTVVALARARG